MNLKYSLESERKKNPFKSKRICYYFGEFNAQLRKVL